MFKVHEMKFRKKPSLIILFFLLLITGCNTNPIASIEISYEEAKSSIEITQPDNPENVACDTSQGDDQCYITVAGTADAPKDYHVCLFLQFQGCEEGWIGGSEGIIDNNEWKVTNVGIGPIEESEYPPLMISAFVTDEPCASGNKQNEKGNSIAETSVLIKR